MRSLRVEVRVDVLAEHVLEVTFAEHDDVVEALATNRAEEAFADCVHEWRLDSGLHDADPGALRDAVEHGRVLVVAIANQDLRSDAERRRITELLSGPLGRWSAGHADVNDLAAMNVVSAA